MSQQEDENASLLVAMEHKLKTEEDSVAGKDSPIDEDAPTEESDRWSELDRPVSDICWRGLQTWRTPGEGRLVDEDCSPCAACRGINFESLNAEHTIPGLGLRQGYMWHASLSAFKISRRTCTVCLALSDPWDEEFYSNFPEEASVWLHCFGLQKQSQPKTGSGHHAPLSFKFLELGLIQKQPGDDTGYVEDWDAYSSDTGTKPAFEVVTFDGDVAAELTNLRVKQPVGPSTASKSSFATARKWIGECLSLSDSSDQHIVPDVVSRPHRLLQIDRGFVTRLIDVSDLSGNILYATLSYTWGVGDAPWKTLTSNVAERLHNFDISLPATIQDAIKITHELGIQYLWVDALCIIQDDDTDWRVEAAKMGKIYQNCIFCIAANTAFGSHGGCFNSPCLSLQASDTPMCAEVVSQIHDGRFSRLGIVRWPYRIATELLGSTGDNGPLAMRAWVLQERLLSPRILYYTEEQLFWECQHCALAEDGLSREKFVVHDDIPLNSRLRSLLRHSSLFCREDFPSPSVLWYDYIVQDMYSKREMTQEKDRLVAVSGIAKAVSALKQQSARYIAGLWDDDLHHGLAWMTRNASSNRRTSQYQAPSWSWASQTGQVAYRYNYPGPSEIHDKARYSYDTGFIVKGCDVASIGDDKFGGIKSARLELQTRLLPDRLVHVTREKHVWDDEEPFSYNDPWALEELEAKHGNYKWEVHMDPPFSEQRVHVECMAIVTWREHVSDKHENSCASILILIPTGSAQTYERAGIAFCRYQGQPDNLVQDYFKRAPLQTIILV